VPTVLIWNLETLSF